MVSISIILLVVLIVFAIFGAIYLLSLARGRF